MGDGVDELALDAVHAGEFCVIQVDGDGLGAPPLHNPDNHRHGCRPEREERRRPRSKGPGIELENERPDKGQGTHRQRPTRHHQEDQAPKRRSLHANVEAPRVAQDIRRHEGHAGPTDEQDRRAQGNEVGRHGGHEGQKILEDWAVHLRRRNPPFSMAHSLMTCFTASARTGFGRWAKAPRLRASATSG